MASTYANVLTTEEVYAMNHLPEVLAAKASLDGKPSGMVYFSIHVTDSIRDTLYLRFGIQLSAGSTVPMRWIKGDTAPHVDVGASTFERTYLLYLNDSPGSLVIDSQSYSIQANTGFVFHEGLPHETQNTEHVPRLLLGPMNEFAEPVGSPIAYFATEADALSFSNALGYGGGYVVGSGGPFGPGGGYTAWRIASTSNGSSPQNVVYQNGDTLLADGTYYLYYANTTKYYIRLRRPASNNVIMFTGFFYVDNTTNIVQTFYDSTNPTVNIRSTGTNGGPTYLYYSGWLCFDGGGCNVTSFPYLYGASQGDYNLYGSTTSSTGNNVDGLGGVTYQFSLTPFVDSIAYYPTQADALANTNAIGNGTSYEVGAGGPFGGYTSWRIASNSTGTSVQTIVYQNGNLLTSDGIYYLYPSAPCFLEGTTVLCQVDDVETYVPIQALRNGMLVKTRLNGYKPIVGIGKGTIQNPGNDERTEQRLYKCSPSKYPDLKEELYLTGCHSILEFPITDKQKEDTIAHLGKLFVTDNKYRLMACIDERAEPWNAEGEYTIWHLALEHADITMNYGIYVNGGLLVETCSIRFLNQKSNMTLIV